MGTTVVEGLQCEHCDHEPFKSKAALGSHVSAKHGLTLDGRPAPSRKKPGRRPSKGNGYPATLRLGRRKIDLILSEKQVRDLLEEHSQEVVDALLVA